MKLHSGIGIRREYFDKGNSKELAAEKDIADCSSQQALKANKCVTSVIYRFAMEYKTETQRSKGSKAHRKGSSPIWVTPF